MRKSQLDLQVRESNANPQKAKDLEDRLAKIEAASNSIKPLIN